MRGVAGIERVPGIPPGEYSRILEPDRLVGVRDELPVQLVNRPPVLVRSQAVEVKCVVDQQEIFPAPGLGPRVVIDRARGAGLEDGLSSVLIAEYLRSGPSLPIIRTDRPDGVADGGAHHGEKPPVRKAGYASLFDSTAISGGIFMIVLNL